MIQKIKNTYHLLQAIIANIFYGFPSHKLKVIGITGTDGKTTTTHLIYHILKSSGKKVSMISTVYAKVGDKEYDTGLHTTTPNAFQVQSMLRLALKAHDEYFILETTSHALDQNRVWGIAYSMGILTNVTHEHLDYHKDYEDYLHTKVLLLNRSNQIIINRDDESYNKIMQNSMTKGKKLSTYGLCGKADYMYDFKKTIPLLAEFNAYNFLAAYVAAKKIGVKEKEILSAMRTFRLPPGRIDIVYDNIFKVIVDFAHTPNAIAKILQTVRSVYLKKGGKIIHVFGSAGLRDVSKRPLMGIASASESDITILTEEDHRIEDPRDICEQIGKGLKSSGFIRKTNLSSTDRKKYSTIIDRYTALQQAIRLAKKDDIVIITGKGHEKSLCRGKTETPWDEVKVVKSILRV